MSIHYCSAVAVVSTDGAIVGSLWAWEPGGWPSQWFDCEFVLYFQQAVFLFNSVPWFLCNYFSSFEDFLGEVSKVSVSRLLMCEFLISPDPSVAHDNDVILFPEWVSAEEDWSQDDL